jgi:hypothetical protein
LGFLYVPCDMAASKGRKFYLFISPSFPLYMGCSEHIGASLKLEPLGASQQHKRQRVCSSLGLFVGYMAGGSSRWHPRTTIHCVRGFWDFNFCPSAVDYAVMGLYKLYSKLDLDQSPRKTNVMYHSLSRILLTSLSSASGGPPVYLSIYQSDLI